MPITTVSDREVLGAAIARVRALLERHLDVEGAADVDAQAAGGEGSSSLDTLCRVFGLSAFERDVLALCAGVEIDGSLAALCARAHGDPARTHASFALALAAFPEAHWSALSPQAPLRGWGLVEVAAGEAPLQSALRIDERILHHLAGLDQLDDRLVPLAAEVDTAALPLTESQETVAGSMVRTWTVSPVRELPVLHITGGDAASRRGVAARVCALLGLRLCAMEVDLLPSNPGELSEMARLWEREAWLDQRALLLEGDGADEQRIAPLVARFAERMRGPLLFSGMQRARCGTRAVARAELPHPTAAEQRTAWRRNLGEQAASLNGTVDRLAAQFRLGPLAIRRAAEQALRDGDSAADLGNRLWHACVEQSRPELDGLARRVEPAATWDDLVLPEAQLCTLREIAVHGRRRATVVEDWGFGARNGRGLGVAVCFSGESGTGKTLAAEVVAGELGLPLYVVDLSQVVSKYIGETEKQLSRLFDAAEQGSAVLLFDEADALFGKRTEVRDSHDRYANIEVSYLLQRMETYRGVAILTTNFRSALDQAFLRRLRFVVHFPFPDEELRAQIWRRVFPAQTPLDGGVDARVLARLAVPGGNIRNIALHAAYLAAEQERPVHMPDLLAAARSEFAKLEKVLIDADLAGWR